MNILIIDDQISVLNGIEHGVHFRELGFERVFFAQSAAEARRILSEETVHIMLCDIEMPGENGLALNRYAASAFPNIIRILLTSHAEFSYAQESIKLGCYDYLLQPAPYDEIEQCLMRAVEKYHLDEERRAVYDKGRLFEELRPEMSDRIVLNLYSANPNTSEESVKMLNRMGYPIAPGSGTRILMLDVLAYVDMTDPKYSDTAIRKAIGRMISSERFQAQDIYPLLTLNRQKRYVLLFFSNSDAIRLVDDGCVRRIHETMKTSLSCDFSMYVSAFGLFPQSHPQIDSLEALLHDNVRLTPALYIAEEGGTEREIVSPELAENVSRWKRIFDGQDFEHLRSSILSYLDYIAASGMVNFKSLCDIHQQLTQLLFNYCYDSHIDLNALFTAEYSYSDLLDAYQNLDTLKRSVNFITGALASQKLNETPENDIEAARIYILNHVSSDITVKEVADHVHRSPEYFTKIFKKVTGQNVKSYITQVKLDVAKDMLANPNIPISMISSEIGYTNFSHFTQMFKKYENVTPTEYRRQKSQQ